MNLIHKFVCLSCAAIFCLVVGLFSLSPACAVDVTFLPSLWVTIAADGENGSHGVFFNGMTTFESPERVSNTATHGASSTTSNIFLRNNTQGALVRNDFTMARAGSPSSRNSFVMWASFTVSEPTSYALSGFFTATSTSGPNNTYELIAKLRVPNTSEILFRNEQESRNLETEEFTLGLSEGNFENQLQGSLTGTLQPGIEYEFTSTVFLRNSSSVSSTDTAVGSGFVELSLGGVTVPEPSALVLIAGVMLRVGVKRFTHQGSRRS